MKILCRVLMLGMMSFLLMYIATYSVAQEAPAAVKSPNPDVAIQGEPSAKPGINERFLDPKLDVSEWLGRFEIESREVYGARETTLRSILRAIKPGGTLVVVDFERIPGNSREFIIGHVRAGKEVFQGEIVEAGFRFVEELTIPSFKENYLLRFRKK
jgi:hypothetical protein